jgi:hypothetical protein
MDKLEDLYIKAVAAAKAMPAAQKRKLLEELAWENARLYGPSARHHDAKDGRLLNTPGNGMTPIKDVSEADLLKFADLREHSGLPYYVPHVTKEMLIKKKVTIYKKPDFGFGHVGHEASAYYLQSRPWAQYRHAFEVTFLPKGAKNMRRYIETSHPSTLIIEGWGHPRNFTEMMTKPVVGGGVTTSMSRHLSHSDEWDREFEVAIKPYLNQKKSKIVLDLRS